MENQPGLNDPPNESDGEPDVFVPEVIAETGDTEPVPAQDEDAMIEESVQLINRIVAQIG